MEKVSALNREPVLVLHRTWAQSLLKWIPGSLKLPPDYTDKLQRGNRKVLNFNNYCHSFLIAERSWKDFNLKMWIWMFYCVWMEKLVRNHLRPGRSQWFWSTLPPDSDLKVPVLLAQVRRFWCLWFCGGIVGTRVGRSEGLLPVLIQN